ncbi:hypothetical protein CXF68_16875 [Tenacibaculum sp. Bg11-29]|uniref:hypothetical protein n=1 Tax=Tenacibaculum sp. Bg11-29 TaxID=2058306 RepID=UPI000C33F4FF|nr:hypothetical protein [Tenacibaculum sp. Bg11-29]PKH52263.1 hypothetical protein CXF68_16875 [Tenacibaculum sp. Bg11-29]
MKNIIKKILIVILFNSLTSCSQNKKVTINQVKFYSEISYQAEKQNGIQCKHMIILEKQLKE